MARFFNTLFIILCIIVIIISGYQVYKYLSENATAQKEMEKIAEEKDSSRGLVDLYKKNNDLIGWVEIKETKVNYPVMQTTSDPEYYLHRDFNKEYSLAGTPFMDAVSSVERATKDPDGELAEDSTWCWLLYGHHMKYGTMFENITKYKDKDFWEKHKKFSFDTIRIDPYTGEVQEVKRTFKVVSAAFSKIKPVDSNEFKYYDYAGCYDEDTFNEFISGIKAEACYDTGITPEYDETTQLCVLSTCNYHTDSGRFYVVGVELHK